MHPSGNWCETICKQCFHPNWEHMHYYKATLIRGNSEKIPSLQEQLLCTEQDETQSLGTKTNRPSQDTTVLKHGVLTLEGNARKYDTMKAFSRLLTKPKGF